MPTITCDCCGTSLPADTPEFAWRDGHPIVVCAAPDCQDSAERVFGDNR